MVSEREWVKSSLADPADFADLIADFFIGANIFSTFTSLQKL
jgi:hypothetical protein